jgi:hypothetical protein
VARAPAEQGLKKVAEPLRAGESTAGKFEPGVPVRRRLELLPLLPLASEAIVGRSFLRVLQNLVGFAEFLEPLLGVRHLADVRVVFSRQTAIRLLDLFQRSVA